MSDKFKRGRPGTEKFFKKHKNFKQMRNLARKHDFREHRPPGQYDPDSRY